MISWRNPDARHADWNFDTYVRAILDALDAVERISGVERTALAGICSGGILASMTAAYLSSTGQEDRLAAFGLAVTVIDSENAGVPPRWAGGARGEGAVEAPRLPRRPRARGGVRLAAPRRPGVELLGQQLPARQEAARVRHPVLERGHHPHDRRAARRLRRHGAGQPAHRTRCDHGSRGADRPVENPDDAYIIAGIADRITPWQNCFRTTHLLGGNHASCCRRAGTSPRS